MVTLKYLLEFVMNSVCPRRLQDMESSGFLFLGALRITVHLQFQREVLLQKGAVTGGQLALCQRPWRNPVK